MHSHSRALQLSQSKRPHLQRFLYYVLDSPWKAWISRIESALLVIFPLHTWSSTSFSVRKNSMKREESYITLLSAWCDHWNPPGSVFFSPFHEARIPLLDIQAYKYYMEDLGSCAEDWKRNMSMGIATRNAPHYCLFIRCECIESMLNLNPFAVGLLIPPRMFGGVSREGVSWYHSCGTRPKNITTNSSIKAPRNFWMSNIQETSANRKNGSL